MAFCTTCGASVNGAFCPQCGTPVSAAGVQPPPVAPPPQAPAAFTPQYMPQAAPPVMAGGRRKTSPIIWVLVIVLGIFVLGGVALVGTGLFVAHKFRQAGVDPELWRTNPSLAAGKMIATLNPNMEVLRTNEGAGTITLRDRRTGKETTISFDDARQGRFRITAEDENGKAATLDFGGGGRLPSWIPAYPGSSPQVTIAGSAGDGEGGNYTFTTPDSASRVMSFYQDRAKDLGMQVNLVANTQDGGTMVAADEGSHRSLTVAVGASGGETTVNVTYGQKR